MFAHCCALSVRPVDQESGAIPRSLRSLLYTVRISDTIPVGCSAELEGGGGFFVEVASVELSGLGDTEGDGEADGNIDDEGEVS